MIQIRNAKKSCWIEFLENAIGKKVFLAYKFTKGNRVEKLPSIKHNDKTCINFDDKCDAFIDVMFPSSSEISNINAN